jgi:ribosomal protein S18 acetylase RimI-like enzyme
MPLLTEDWRTCAPNETEPLLRCEAAAWRQELFWDVTASWAAIEPARATGHLPGLVVRDEARRIRGWTWYLQHAGCLQVAALVADAPDVSRALVDGVLESVEASTAVATIVTLRGRPPGAQEALEARNLKTAPWMYLRATIGARPARGGDVGRPWRESDVPAVADLCARAYADADGVRAFAPLGTDAEWREYLRTLLYTNGCGNFLAAASRIVEGPDGRPVAAIITAEIAPTVAHVSQIVVDPAAQGRGLGREVLGAALSSAEAMGYGDVTLLVASDNRAARHLYATVGFVERADFLVAGGQPRRSTSLALAAEGISTRR